jgi:protein TonB
MVVADVQPATGPIEASTVVPEAAQVTPEEQPVAALPETIVAEAPPADISVEASTVQSEMAEVTPREQLLEIASETTAEEMLPVAIAREAPSAPVEIALVSAPDQPLETIATSPRDASTSGAVSVPPSEGPEIRAVSYAVPADETTVKLQLAEAVDVTDVVQAETIEVAEAVPTRQIVREAPEPAAVANYPGSVVSKLRSEVRYPLEAAGKRLKGEVHVAFIISADGNVSGINVVRSSGSSILDMAAMDIVRRSAPFPAIPAEAARSDWPLTVPFIFTRLGEQAQNAADPIVEGD